MRRVLSIALAALPAVLGGCEPDAPDECASGATQCAPLSEVVERCEYSLILGHTVWEPVVDCRDYGQVCRWVRGEHTCVAP